MKRVSRALPAMTVAVSLVIATVPGIPGGAVEPGTTAAGSSESVQPVDFNHQIRPIFTRYCTSCHGGVKQAGDLSFVYADRVLPPDGWVIEPGDPDSSVLIERIKSDDRELRMPPPDDHPDPLPTAEIELLERWIAEGARWGGLWSMEALHPQPVPAVVSDSETSSSQPRQPLDQWVYQRLNVEGLTFSPQASPQEWLRRASFDLIGLPPSIEQVETFTAEIDASIGDGAREAVYARQVDRLLASERFGERWASVWMDLARYADSKGFEKDPHRDMWPYRDWLIRAFNDDMPYDQFTISQLAGDLLDNPSADDLIATAFHRNTQTNTEGGTDDEEFRVAALIDRINTTWTVWQGTTFGCVQCHSHPYDAFKHEEYYACMAILNDTMDCDLDSDYPTLTVPEQATDRESAIAVQQNYERLRVVRNQLGRDIAENVRWESLPVTSAASSEGRLRIDGDHVRTDGGTFPPGVRYTIETPAAPLAALRVEILPESDSPALWPEQGSVLSQLTVTLVQPDGAAEPVPLADVFADALTGPEDPRSSLDKSIQGVGGYPKLHRPRWAVFVLAQPLDKNQFSDGAHLKLELKQSNSVAGNLATPIRNLRLQRCDDPAWMELLESSALADADRSLADAKRSADAIRGAALPVMQPRDAAVGRMTRQFVRGNWLDRGQEINPGIPQSFLSNRGTDAALPITGRLQFARWLVSDENPLAARVWANRVWSQLFGTGLVETLEDFGSSGLQPTHPELLDHLAVRLRTDHRWQLKPLLREIVLSSTYRQTNQTSPQGIEKDPRNLLLGRGPRTRLSAEMVRDQSLFVSGLMAAEIGGPSVMPLQPDGVWQTVYSGAQWSTPEGSNRYRRALYTYWRRTSPYPSFLMFDSPTRDLCSARRIATNTPLQALVTLNDPVYVECARSLAERALRSEHQNGNDPTQAIDWMYRVVTQRTAGPVEQAELNQLYQDLDAGTDGIDVNALSIVASTLLNLDRALTK